MRVVVVSRQPLWRDALSALVAAELPADPVVSLDDVSQLAALDPVADDLILLEDSLGQSITHASIKRPALIMEAVGNIVDELMSAKKQALAAAFASM